MTMDSREAEALAYQLDNFGLSREAIAYRTRKKQLENAGWKLAYDEHLDWVWKHEHPRTRIGKISDREVYRMDNAAWWRLWQKHV